MVPKSDHLANPRFDKKPSAQVNNISAPYGEDEHDRQRGVLGLSLIHI